MTCKCGSNRIAGIHGKCSDLGSVSIPHLDFEHQGYQMDLGVGSGDYIDFELCLDCGQVQDFVPISDEEIKASEEWEMVKGTEEEQEREAELDASEPAVFSMAEVEYRKINQLLNANFGNNWRFDKMNQQQIREILTNSLETDDCSDALRKAIFKCLGELK